MEHLYIIDTKLWTYWLKQRNKPISQILNHLADMLYSLGKRGDIIMCFDIGKSTFRLAEQSYYKGHRATTLAKQSDIDKVEHMIFSEIYNKMPELFRLLPVRVLSVHGVEADDLASLAVEYFKSHKKITLITNDEDWLHMVVGTKNVRWYNGITFKTHKDVVENYKVNSRREFSILKSISGDKSDNIKFLSGVAKVKGEKIFKRIQEKYSNPNYDHILVEVEKEIQGKSTIFVHPLHVSDGRTTMVDAFTSNMKIADPFTTTDNLTEEQRAKYLECLTYPIPKVASLPEVHSKLRDVFGYEVHLSELAKLIFKVTDA